MPVVQQAVEGVLLEGSEVLEELEVLEGSEGSCLEAQTARVSFSYGMLIRPVEWSLFSPRREVVSECFLEF